jgi:5-formyltetrahydrofolate cyclo-ligase
MRADAKARIAAIGAEGRERASSAAQVHVLAMKEYKECANIFLYLAFGTEVGTARILEDSWRERKRVLVPVFSGREYRLVEYGAEDQLAVGKYGIEEPQGTADYEPRGDLLAIVPGLAFDRKCRRLGRGGGYYDRILGGLATAGVGLVSVGLTYSATVCDEVPAESFDFDVDIVVTENESIRKSSLDGSRGE